MAREKHPSFHNPTIQKALSSSRYDVIMAAFSTQSQLTEFRRKLYALRRAHKLWKTEEHQDFANFKSRQFKTSEMIEANPAYEVDPHKYPLTLIFTCQKITTPNEETNTSIEETPIFSEKGKEIDRAQPLTPQSPEGLSLTNTNPTQYVGYEGFENDNLINIIGSLTDEDATDEDLN